MVDPIIRPRNVAMLFKLESTQGEDASPSASDAFPFEADGYSYNSPYTNEASNEVNGTLVDAAPLIVGQPAEVSIRVRMKGVGGSSAYSASIKPPHHSLLEVCGKRGVFTAAVSAASLAAGTTSSATLGTGFASVAQSYRGMPLILAGGTSGGRTAHIADYSAAKVATLTDLFASALTTAASAAIPANWTYAGTSPKDVASRATDHPTGTLYIYEDGSLHKFIGCRGSISDWSGNTARPGFMTFDLMGIYAGKTTAAIPTVTIPQHSAPVLAMGNGGVNPALLINRKELRISNWSMAEGGNKEVIDDPNTPFGFGSPEIAGRSPLLTIDPLATHVENRDTIAEIEAGTEYSGVIRMGNTAQNRVSITFPKLLPVNPAVGQRGIARTEQLGLRALTAGPDASLRDSDSILCYS